MKYKIIYAIPLFIVVACASKRNHPSQPLSQNEQKIVFLNFTISKGSKGKSITFINKIITDGNLKTSSYHFDEEGSIGDLKCSQLDKDSSEINHVFVKNPLSKTVEYVNDSLFFENKKLDLDKAAFSLRLQLDSRTAFIEIREIIDTLQHTNWLITTNVENQ